jgi:soluble lytic murein transglycosylase
MSDILGAQRIDILDAAASLKISKLRCLFSEHYTGLSVQEEKRLAYLIYQESVRHQYDPELIMAIIFAESSFHNWSRSKKGAIGLMQILPKTGMELAQSNDLPFYSSRSLFDPRLNVKFGVQYLTYLHHRFGDLELALTAYNYGPTRVSQWLSEDQPLPTRYTRKVLAHYQTFMDEETD